MSDADLEDLESDLEDEEYTEMRIMGIEDEDMGIGGESIESIDEIKKITPIKRIQKVKKIQEVKDIKEVPEHVARKFLEVCLSCPLQLQMNLRQSFHNEGEGPY